MQECCLLHSARHDFLLCLRLYLQLSKIKQKEFFDHACRAISSRRLVPGDVIVVLPGKATCDMVLLQGNCLVEESVLSGEVLTHLKPGHTVGFDSVASTCIGCAACLFDQQPNWKHRPFCLKISLLQACIATTVGSTTLHMSVHHTSAMCLQMHNISSVHPAKSSTLC